LTGGFLLAEGYLDNPNGWDINPGTGDTIDGWNVEAIVHSLADTRVYRVSRGGSIFALKMVQPARSNWVYRALKNEAEILAQLSLRAVPRLVDSNLDGHLPYIVIEWC